MGKEEMEASARLCCAVDCHLLWSSLASAFPAQGRRGAPGYLFLWWTGRVNIAEEGVGLSRPCLAVAKQGGIKPLHDVVNCRSPNSCAHAFQICNSVCAQPRLHAMLFGPRFHAFFGMSGSARRKIKSCLTCASLQKVRNITHT